MHPRLREDTGRGRDLVREGPGGRAEKQEPQKPGSPLF